MQRASRLAAAALGAAALAAAQVSPSPTTTALSYWNFNTQSGVAAPWATTSGAVASSLSTIGTGATWTATTTGGYSSSVSLVQGGTISSQANASVGLQFCTSTVGYVPTQLTLYSSSTQAGVRYHSVQYSVAGSSGPWFDFPQLIDAGASSSTTPYVLSTFPIASQLSNIGHAGNAVSNNPSFCMRIVTIRLSTTYLTPGGATSATGNWKLDEVTLTGATYYAPTPSQTGTPSASAPTPSQTGTPSASITGTPSASRTGTPSASRTGTPSASRTGTPSSSQTPSGTGSSSATLPAVPSTTPTNTGTPSPTASATASLTATPTGTPSSSGTQTGTPSPSQTPTGTPSPSGTPSNTASVSSTATSTRTPTASSTGTPTPTASLTATRTGTPASTPTKTGTATPPVTPSSTGSPPPTPSGTPTPSQSALALGGLVTLASWNFDATSNFLASSGGLFSSTLSVSLSPSGSTSSSPSRSTSNTLGGSAGSLLLNAIQPTQGADNATLGITACVPTVGGGVSYAPRALQFYARVTQGMARHRALRLRASAAGAWSAAHDAALTASTATNTYEVFTVALRDLLLGPADVAAMAGSQVCFQLVNVFAPGTSAYETVTGTYSTSGASVRYENVAVLAEALPTPSQTGTPSPSGTGTPSPSGTGTPSSTGTSTPSGTPYPTLAVSEVPGALVWPGTIQPFGSTSAPSFGVPSWSSTAGRVMWNPATGAPFPVADGGGLDATETSTVSTGVYAGNNRALVWAARPSSGAATTLYVLEAGADAACRVATSPAVSTPQEIVTFARRLLLTGFLAGDAPRRVVSLAPTSSLCASAPTAASKLGSYVALSQANKAGHTTAYFLGATDGDATARLVRINADWSTTEFALPAGAEPPAYSASAAQPYPRAFGSGQVAYLTAGGAVAVVDTATGDVTVLSGGVAYSAAFAISPVSATGGLCFGATVDGPRTALVCWTPEGGLVDASADSQPALYRAGTNWIANVGANVYLPCVPGELSGVRACAFNAATGAWAVSWDVQVTYSSFTPLESGDIYFAAKPYSPNGETTPTLHVMRAL